MGVRKFAEGQLFARGQVEQQGTRRRGAEVDPYRTGRLSHWQSGVQSLQAGPWPHPPFDQDERFSRMRLTDGLGDMTAPPHLCTTPAQAGAVTPMEPNDDVLPPLGRLGRSR